MKLAIEGVLLSTLLVLGVATSASAAQDPVVGSWKLNVAKSTFKSGAVPTAQTRTYAQTEKGLSVTINTSAGGKEQTMTASYALDGKDYTVTGNPDWDAIVGKQVDPNKAEFTFKRGGKSIGTTNRMVSKDGKTLTTESTYTDAKGGKVENTMVFERQ